MAARTRLISTTTRLRVRQVCLERRATASKVVRGSLVSLVGLVGGRITTQAGGEAGRLVDVVARLYGAESYSPVNGLILLIGAADLRAR